MVPPLSLLPIVRLASPASRRLAVPLVVALVLAAAISPALPAGAAARVSQAAAPAAALATALGSRGATRDAPVPADLRPSVWAATRDYPKPYRDGCHVEQEGGAPPYTRCLYGDRSAQTTVVLFGDSHALSWFPAAERVAIDRGWRLLSVTMSACTPADIPAYIPRIEAASTACADWREAALDLIARVHPAVVLAAGTRGFATTDDHGNVVAGPERTAIWEAGIRRTIDRLKESAGDVIWIADTPISSPDRPACLASHPRSTLACATPVKYAVNTTWLNEEYYVSQAEGVGFIDPSTWVCPTSPCPAVIGRVQLYRDGGHLTATFMGTLRTRLGRAVDAYLETRTPS